MPQRSSVLQPEPTSLRRSPRFFHSPTTPKPTSTNPVFPSSLTPQSNPKNGSTISGKKNSTCSEKSINGSSNCVETTNGSRRMTRLSGKVDGFETRRRSPRFRNEVKSFSNGSKKGLNLMGKDIVKSPVTPIRDGERKLIDYETSDSCREVSMRLDRRITRSQSRLMHRNIKVGKSLKNEKIGCNSLKRCTHGINTRISCSKGKENRIDCCKENIIGYSDRKDGNVGDSNRRTTRSAAKNLTQNAKKENERIFEKEANGTQELPTKRSNVVRKDTCDASNVSRILGRDEKKEEVLGKDDNKMIGVKRKRNEVGLQGTSQGWTKEQEVALHKAYFTARPSPHFWKKVSKLVPGKSAQECFDKVHSENQTPVFSKPNSRTRKHNSPSDILLSGNKLFKSSEKSKSKKACKSKFRSQATRKTVRRLLQKNCRINQNDEADLFSVLEPSVIPSSQPNQVTPKNMLKSPDPSSKSYDRSSSAFMNRLSRFSNKSESPLVSPPVLKKVKNMALHEKYIDLLHVRDRKRKVAFSRYSKSIRNQESGEVNSVQMKDMIKVAKNALVSDARDVIDKFRDSQANIMEAFSESEEFDGSDSDEDETL